MKDLREYQLKRDEAYHYFRTIMKDDCYKGDTIIMTFANYANYGKEKTLLYMIGSHINAQFLDLNFVI